MRRSSKLIAGVLGVCLALAGALLLINLAIRAEARRHQCNTNMKNLGLAIQMYAMDSEGGLFPELSAEPGRLFWTNRAACNPSPVFPEYLSDLSILICPSQRTENLDVWSELSDIRVMDDHSYFYLGYAIQNQQDLEAFAQAYKIRIAEEKGFSGDLEVKNPHGSMTLHRLRKDVARDLLGLSGTAGAVRELESRLPVLIERLGHHCSRGGNVLYLDGQVEFIPEGEWPYAAEAQALLEKLDAAVQANAGE
jgi:prepilin-type processing-associated H-X9-DG protein